MLVSIDKILTPLLKNDGFYIFIILSKQLI